METTEIKQDITLITKLYIWARTTVFIMGLVSIGVIVRSSIVGLPACFKSVELRVLDSQIGELGSAMAKAQDDIEDNRTMLQMKLVKK